MFRIGNNVIEIDSLTDYWVSAQNYYNNVICILFQKLMWPLVLMTKKIFWNDKKNLFEHGVFKTEYFINLFLEVPQMWYLVIIIIQNGKKMEVRKSL